MHPAPVNPFIKGNIQVFPEVSVSEKAHAQLYQHFELTHKPQMNFSNPINENSKQMFVPPVLNHSSPHNGNEVNP